MSPLLRLRPRRFLAAFLAPIAVPFALAGIAGCGGGRPVTSAGPAEPAAPLPLKSTAAERCLEAAGAKRSKRDGAPSKIGARHLLVKYAGSKNAPPTVKRTREEACLRALEARNKLQQGVDFVDLVKEYSEEPGAATRGGSLGPIQRSDVVPPFADAAFELDLNQVSDVVETDFGFHIIMRTE